MKMQVVFRADASLDMGTGHVMRCLTLAKALGQSGAQCRFICREHAGNLIGFIQDQGFNVHCLPIVNETCHSNTAHKGWLGSSVQTDANACIALLKEQQPDWLIVDHYALDSTWEQQLSTYSRHIMVIDDLADRKHHCDLLLDQTFGRQGHDYKSLVRSNTLVLTGAQFALLRPEFAKLRNLSLSRRQHPQFKNLLISMGGVDKENATAKVLETLKLSNLPKDCKITVIMGATAPWLDDIRALSHDMPWPTEVKVGVNNMAELMSQSDLAIGAAGSTAWERCTLGLPCIMIVLADNQQSIANALSLQGAAYCIDHPSQITHYLPNILRNLTENPQLFINLTLKAARVCEGNGISAVVKKLERMC